MLYQCVTTGVVPVDLVKYVTVYSTTDNIRAKILQYLCQRLNENSPSTRIPACLCLAWAMARAGCLRYDYRVLGVIKHVRSSFLVFSQGREKLRHTLDYENRKVKSLVSDIVSFVCGQNFLNTEYPVHKGCCNEALDHHAFTNPEGVLARDIERISASAHRWLTSPDPTCVSEATHNIRSDIHSALRKYTSALHSLY